LSSIVSSPWSIWNATYYYYTLCNQLHGSVARPSVSSSVYNTLKYSHLIIPESVCPLVKGSLRCPSHACVRAVHHSGSRCKWGVSIFTIVSDYSWLYYTSIYYGSDVYLRDILIAILTSTKYESVEQHQQRNPIGERLITKYGTK
jgi:hypothetical protein